MKQDKVLDCSKNDNARPKMALWRHKPSSDGLQQSLGEQCSIQQPNRHLYSWIREWRSVNSGSHLEYVDKDSNVQKPLCPSSAPSSCNNRSSSSTNPIVNFSEALLLFSPSIATYALVKQQCQHAVQGIFQVQRPRVGALEDTEGSEVPKYFIKSKCSGRLILDPLASFLPQT